MSRPFRALKHRNYRLWASGAIVSNTGTWMQRTAQDWLVLAVLTDHSALALGVITALQFGPMLVLPLFAGSLADRWPKRRILMATQAGMGLCGLVLGLLVVTGVIQLWMVFALALLLGVTAAFDGPARQSFVSEMVPGPDLTSAVSLNASSFNSGRLLGPALAGLLISWIGVGPVFLLNAVSFAGVLVSLARMRVADLYPPPAASRARARVRDAVRSVVARPRMVAPLALVFVVAAFGLNFQVTNGLMATTVFDRGAGEYGILGSLLALGSLTGALLAARRPQPRMRIIVGSALAFGALVTGAAFLPSFWAYAVALTPVGLAGTTMLTTSNQSVQLDALPGERGRVLGMYLMVNQGGGALGAPVIGWVATEAGARASVLMCGLVAVVAGVGVSAYLLRATSSRLRWHRSGTHRLHLDVVTTSPLQPTALTTPDREAA
jgi:MFS family permease